MKISASDQLKEEKQRASMKYMAKLVEILKECTEPANVPPKKLKELRMTKKEFKQHWDEKNFFIDREEDGYDFARESLKQRGIKKLKQHVLLACKNSKRRPTIKLIQQTARGAAPKVDWVPGTFRASLSWCQDIRTKVVRPERRQTKKKQYFQWVEQRIATRGVLYSQEARTKYEEMYGKTNYKAWESFSGRLRKKLELKSEVSQKGWGSSWSKRN